jgi:hypothetical protein
MGVPVDRSDEFFAERLSLKARLGAGLGAVVCLNFDLTITLNVTQRCIAWLLYSLVTA